MFKMEWEKLFGKKHLQGIQYGFEMKYSGKTAAWKLYFL